MKRLFHHAVIPGTGWPGDPATANTPVAPLDGAVAELAEAASDLGKLDAAVSVCRACPRLVAWREEVGRVKKKTFADEKYWARPAPGFGDGQGALAVVGLAPAAHGANRTGRVFTGDRSGDFLTAALYRGGYANQPTSTHAGDGLALRGARILSAVRCAPPQNKPTPAEQRECAPWLDRELELLRPRVILALGAIGWRSVALALGRLGYGVPRPRPTFGHGTEYTAGPVAVVGSYHPSQHNTFTGRLTDEMFDAVLVRCGEIIAAPLESRTDPS